ncbi:AraC family transcriptional regulator [Bacillus fengqiuensis]|nr:AraC family transcriptional regulator [Bacillus fengqiuensis]
MQGEIVVKQGFSVIGFAKNGSHQQPQDKGVISSLWKQVKQRKQEIQNTMDEHTITGICLPPRSAHYFYIAGVEVESGQHIPNGMSVHTFPTYTYIRYRHKGPVSRLFDTYGKIWEEWFPASGHSLIKGPELEIVNVKHSADPNSEEYEMDIYIPIKLGTLND